MELSFAEQIRILLNRRHMTIKELAELYTRSTGQTMSRQNLTQRLKRDNFPEQDMHILAGLLGYRVSISLEPIAEGAAEGAAVPSLLSPAPAPERDGAREAKAEAPAQEQPAAPAAAQDRAPKREPPDPPLPDEEPVSFRIPEAFRKPRPQGDINPLNGEEYLTNTVRVHPTQEGFLQVYDRGTHAWSDVEEDSFWQFQERKKEMMGGDYRPPIRI